MSMAHLTSQTYRRSKIFFRIRHMYWHMEPISYSYPYLILKKKKLQVSMLPTCEQICNLILVSENLLRFHEVAFYISDAKK